MNHELDRRGFLKAAGTAVGVAGLAAGPLGFAAEPAGSAPQQPQTSPPAAGARRRMLRKSLKYGMVAGGSSVLEKFELAKEAGFEGIELDSPNSLKADDVLRARDAAGLVIDGVVDSVHWNKTLGDPDPAVRAAGREALETALRDCKCYGGTSALLVPAVVSKEISYADAYARSQEEIRKVLPLAAELRIAIAIENVWNNFLLSPLEAARYVDEFGSPWVGWHFDVGNVVNYGWPEQWIRILGPRIVKLDIKEYSRHKRDQQGPGSGFAIELGEGDCDWPAVMQALDDIGFQGWAAAEVGGGDLERLKKIATTMDRLFGTEGK
jgi:L-ribulose-5-phosphate 3-epimerase